MVSEVDRFYLRLCVDNPFMREQLVKQHTNMLRAIRDVLLEESVSMGCLWGVKFARKLGAPFRLFHLEQIISQWETPRTPKNDVIIVEMILNAGIVDKITLPDWLLKPLWYGRLDLELESLLFSKLALPPVVQYARALRSDPQKLGSIDVSRPEAIREIFRLAVTQGPGHVALMPNICRLQPSVTTGAAFDGALDVVVKELTQLNVCVPWVATLVIRIASMAVTCPKPALDVRNAWEILSFYCKNNPQLIEARMVLKPLLSNWQQLPLTPPTPPTLSPPTLTMSPRFDLSSRGLSPHAAEFTPEMRAVSPAEGFPTPLASFRR